MSLSVIEAPDFKCSDEIRYILLLDTVLSSCCSICILIGLWPFRGLFHHWMFVNADYKWIDHIQMGWFDVGCIGLFCTNLQAYVYCDELVGEAAYRMVFTTNAVMHGLWGTHNLQMAYRKLTKKDDGTRSELRRFGPLFLWSLLGACGSGMVRNIYASVVELNELSMEFIVVTWIWEWLSLILILLDLAYYLFKEGGCQKCLNKDVEQKVKESQALETVEPTSPQSPSSSHAAL